MKLITGLALHFLAYDSCLPTHVESRAQMFVVLLPEEPSIDRIPSPLSQLCRKFSLMAAISWRLTYRLHLGLHQ